MPAFAPVLSATIDTNYTTGFGLGTNCYTSNGTTFYSQVAGAMTNEYVDSSGSVVDLYFLATTADQGPVTLPASLGGAGPYYWTVNARNNNVYFVYAESYGFSAAASGIVNRDALNAALAAASAGGARGTVLMPKGTFTILRNMSATSSVDGGSPTGVRFNSTNGNANNIYDNCIKMPSNVVLQGAGRGATILVAEVHSETMVFMNSNYQAGGNITNSTLRAFTLDCNRANQIDLGLPYQATDITTGGAQSGFLLRGSKINVQDVEVLNAVWDGVILETSDNCMVQNNHVHDTGKDGIYMSDGTDNVVTNNISRNHVGTGISLAYQRGTAAEGNVCEYNGAAGLFLGRVSDNCTVRNNHLLWNNSSASQIQLGALDVNELNYTISLVDTFTADSGTDTITFVTAGTVFSKRLRVNSPISFANVGGGLPGGLAINTMYYIRSITGDAVTLTTAPGGALLDITTNGTGTNSMYHCFTARSCLLEGNTIIESGRTSANPTTVGTFTADSTTDTLTFTVNGAVVNAGLAVNSPVYFTNAGGGLPAGLVANTVYYIKTLTGTSTTSNAITLSATSGPGALLDITTNGTGTQTMVWRYRSRVGIGLFNTDSITVKGGAVDRTGMEGIRVVDSINTVMDNITVRAVGLYTTNKYGVGLSSSVLGKMTGTVVTYCTFADPNNISGGVYNGMDYAVANYNAGTLVDTRIFLNTVIEPAVGSINAALTASTHSIINIIEKAGSKRAWDLNGQYKQSGWTAWTGTATRTSFATGAATTQNVAEALKALIDNLLALGLLN